MYHTIARPSVNETPASHCSSLPNLLKRTTRQALLHWLASTTLFHHWLIFCAEVKPYRDLSTTKHKPTPCASTLHKLPYIILFPKAGSSPCINTEGTDFSIFSRLQPLPSLPPANVSPLVCNSADYLPFTCSACAQVFCLHHRDRAEHSCSNIYAKDVRQTCSEGR